MTSRLKVRGGSRASKDEVTQFYKPLTEGYAEPGRRRQDPPLGSLRHQRPVVEVEDDRRIIGAVRPAIGELGAVTVLDRDRA